MISFGGESEVEIDSMNACNLLLTSLFTLQTVLNVVQTSPEAALTNQDRLAAPNLTDLAAPTETERLQHWLERLFPEKCEGSDCKPLIEVRRWTGRLKESTRFCQARMFYGRGEGIKSTFDVFLLFAGSKANERGATFRTTMIYGPPDAPTLLPDVKAEEWASRLPFLESSTQVTLNQVTLRSRPMIRGLTTESYLSASPHEIVIEFGPTESVRSMTGKDIASGETMTCDFAGGS